MILLKALRVCCVTAMLSASLGASAAEASVTRMSANAGEIDGSARVLSYKPAPTTL
jgi:hypothetical protein